MTERLLTVADLCERLSVTRDWVYQRVHARELPHLKIGHRSLRFDAQAIEEWLAERSIDREK